MSRSMVQSWITLTWAGFKVVNVRGSMYGAAEILLAKTMKMCLAHVFLHVEPIARSHKSKII